MLVWTRVNRARTSGLLGALLLLLLTQVAQAVPASAPALNPPVVAGPRVTLNWSAVPGAAGYRLAVGTAPGTEGYAHAVGAVTTVTFNSPFVGTGYVRVQAFDATGLGPVSNEVQLIVTSLSPVPAAPVGLQASLSGRTVNLSWGPGAGGGAPQAVVLEAGTSPGGANLGATPLPLSTQVSIPGVAPGTYFVRVYAANASGRSNPSNEVRIDMPVGGGCTAPAASSLSVSVSGSTVSFCVGRRPRRGRLSPGSGVRAEWAGDGVAKLRRRDDRGFVSGRAGGHLLCAGRLRVVLRRLERVGGHDVLRCRGRQLVAARGLQILLPGNGCRCRT